MKKLISLFIVCVLIMSSAYAATIVRYDGPFDESGGDAFSLVAYGDYCYVSAYNGGLRIFNISDIENIKNVPVDNPDLKSTMPTDGAQNIAVYKDKLYAAFGSGKGIMKLSLEDPENPTVIAKDGFRPNALDFAFYEDMMFVIQNFNLHIFDISDDSLTLMRSINLQKDTLDRGRGVCVYGDKLYVGCYKGLIIYDIPTDDPADVAEICRLSFDGGASSVDSQFICANDEAVFIPRRSNKSLYVVDKRGVSDLSQLTEDNLTVFENITEKNMRSCSLYENLLFITDFGNLYVYDVYEPTVPICVSKTTGIGDATGQSIIGDVDFLAVRTSGIRAIDMSDFSYLAVRDEYTSLPSVMCGRIGNEDNYSIYIDGEKVYTGASDGGKIKHNIYNLSSGTHQIGYSYVDSSSEYYEEYYDTAANTSRQLSVSALDSTGNVLPKDSSPAEVSRIALQNNTKEIIEATLICAFYKDKKMEYTYYPVSIDPNDSVCVPEAGLSIPENIGAEDTFKAFVLKSFDNPILISDCATLGSETVNKEKNSSSVKGGLNADISNVDYNINSVEITLRKSGYLMPQTAFISVKPNGSGFDDLDYADVMDLSDGEAKVSYFYDTSVASVPFSVIAADYGFITENIESRKSFTHLGPDEIAEILTGLKLSGGGTSTEQCLMDNNGLFGIDMSDESDYASLEEEYKKEILKAMAASFESTTDVKNEFNKRVEIGLLLTRINSASREQLDEILSDSDNQKLLNINSLYNAMTDAGKKESGDKLFKKITSGELIYGEPDFSEYFNSECAVILLNTTGYLEIPSVLELMNEEIDAGFDLDGDYSKLSNTENGLIYVNKTMERTEFTSVENAVSVFNEAVKTAMSSKSTSNNRKTSSSGGGISVGSVSVPADKSTVDLTPINDKKFSDLSDTHWANEAILALTECGIISGYPDGSFRPDDLVTREEFSKILYEFIDTEISFSGDAFDDVSENDWYYKYVMSLKEAGIINGMSETHFGIGDSLTREDMAAVVTRTVQYKKISLPENTAPVLIDFNDIAEYARQGVRRLSMAGIMVGDDMSMFRPKDYVTRAMAAKVIYELMTICEAQ